MGSVDLTILNRFCSLHVKKTMFCKYLFSISLNCPTGYGPFLMYDSIIVSKNLFICRSYNHFRLLQRAPWLIMEQPRTYNSSIDPNSILLIYFLNILNLTPPIIFYHNNHKLWSLPIFHIVEDLSSISTLENYVLLSLPIFCISCKNLKFFCGLFLFNINLLSLLITDVYIDPNRNFSYLY